MRHLIDSFCYIPTSRTEGESRRVGRVCRQDLYLRLGRVIEERGDVPEMTVHGSSTG